jgi:hypothetical protein
MEETTPDRQLFLNIIGYSIESVSLNAKKDGFNYLRK